MAQSPTEYAGLMQASAAELSILLIIAPSGRGHKDGNMGLPRSIILRAT
jgi:hypothetical protein